MSEKKAIVDPDLAPEYGSILGSTWSALVDLLKQREDGEVLLKELGPTLVRALKATLEELENQSAQDKLHKRYVELNPSTKPRRSFNPLHFMASFLVQHNPRFDSKPPSAGEKAYIDALLSSSAAAQP